MKKQNQAIKKALAFEDQRKLDLKAGEYFKVLNSYKKQKVFLPDNNSGQFWDQIFNAEINKNNDPFIFQFPMEAWRIKKVLSNLNLKQSVLNLGVGAGRLEAHLLTKIKTKQYLGTDITQKTLKSLRKHWPNFKFIKADLLKLPIKNQQFDQVCLLEVLEHIKPNQTFKLLNEINRVLKPGGRFLVSVPVNEGLEKMLPENPNSHMRLYSLDLLEFELKAAGFKLEKVYQTSAFAKQFKLKHLLNSFYHFRQVNNCLLIVKKV